MHFWGWKYWWQSAREAQSYWFNWVCCSGEKLSPDNVWFGIYVAILWKSKMESLNRSRVWGQNNNRTRDWRPKDRDIVKKQNFSGSCDRHLGIEKRDEFLAMHWGSWRNLGKG